ncbi:SIP domain-containing protein [Microbacterium azadirachtae]|uniref:SIP domain-containing protein n=1 Tax=Microbacterium azadirachtae TaxID=582680 RepID=UPI00088F7BDC|nr:SIP domain-containing protein [Microbacterium azadirachtae]UXW84776.1 siderophore-interacting protein [Microbacterium azadirachtae]SDM48484.1 Siderophore-interacting protein [Microbacterium azadirachtae]SEG59674.1 Siderophore-interacting protein [Microbacterium azadirachtae]SEG61985.1 Siderophore-interacting protein [Microbacterium azadirachtae]
MTTAIRTARAERRALRRSAKVQHLVVADENSLAELEALLATLPLCATGRVFVEVPDAGSVSTLTVPPRMTVTWLPRAARTGAPGSGRRCAPGTAVSRAAIAWADEMLCDGAEDRTSVTLLGGFLGTADIAEHLTESLGMAPEHIAGPERFGL